MSSNDNDELEYLYGDTPSAAIGRAQQSVVRWRIEAVGRRTTDHMARDLLIGSWRRDRRQRLFNGLCMDPAPWIGRRTIGHALRNVACQITAFHFLHMVHLHQLASFVGGPRLKVVHQLMRCWPQGLQVEWAGPRIRSGRDVCRRARQCPFCFARKAIKLYRRLQTIVPSGETEDLYVLACVKIPDELFAAGLQFTVQDQCHFVRHQVGEALVEHVKLLGADGGVLTFLVGPRRSHRWTGVEVSSDPTAGFEYRLAVLGRIASPTQDLSELLVSRAGPVMRTFGELGGEPLDIEYDTLADPQALRLLLVGSSIGYRHRNGRGNFVGAFALPSWNLSTREQWLTHLDATKNMRLYSCWGTLLRRRSATNQQRRLPPMSAGPGGAERRQLAFDRQNASARLSASNRRQFLLEEVESLAVFEPDLREFGRVQLRAELDRRGIEISDRDARWLVTQLRPEYPELAALGFTF